MTLPQKVFLAATTSSLEPFQEVQLETTSYLLRGSRLHANLYLFTALERQEVYGQIFSIAQLVMGGTLLGFIMLMTLLYFMLERLVIHPIMLLSHAVARLGRGHYDIVLPATRISEISRLFGTFNAMVGDLEELHRRIEEHNRQLESRVEERTLELSQKIEELTDTRNRLIEASQEAERANQAKSIFLATMSHEIRSPMNGVLGMLELLTGSGLTPGQYHMAQMATRSAEGLLAILNDILDFSKVEAGKLTLEEIPFELPALLELVCNLLAPRAMEKGLELYCETIGLPNVIVEGDPTRLQQVLTNLISNAIKFTDQGEVALRVWREDHSGSSLRLWFAVQDSGIGMGPEGLVKLFQPFSQADTTISRRFGGTGLGLAICHRLVGLMGGELTVTSQVGAGSTFKFFVDFQVHSWEESPAPLHHQRVMLMDRHKVTEAILRRMLTAMGVDVVSPPEPITTCHALIQVVDDEVVSTEIPTLPHPDHVPRLLITPMATLCEPSLGTWLLSRPVISFRLEEALRAALSNTQLATSQAIPGQDAKFQGHVLLAEDNAINQQVALEMLRRLGVSAEVAGNGRKACALFEHHPYDLVLMDMQMPEMDGLEAARQIRVLESKRGGPRTPIVAMTANAMAQDRQACLAAGMDNFLSKPVRIKMLTEMLAHWLPAAPMGKPVPAPSQPVTPAPTPALPMLDMALYQELQEVMGGDFAALQQEFLQDTALRLEELALAIQANQAATVKSRAHQLKGIGSSFGAMAFSRLCGQLQEMGHKGDLTTAMETLKDIKTAFTAVHKALTAGEHHD